MRIANAVFWICIWLAIAVDFNAFDNPARLIGEALIPAVLLFAIDAVIRRRRTKNSN